MRHGKKVNHLGRTDSHRKAMLGNMASSLILHKRITTTLAKAKALRVYVEPIITKSKSDTTHSRRTVFSYLQDKDAVTILFREVAEKVANRPGGYTRIIKMENRLGDNAEMALIELVDYNTVYGQDTGKAEKKSTRRRGGKAKAGAPVAAAPAAKAAPAEAVVVEEPVAEAPVAEAVVEETPVVEEVPAAEATETPEASAENEENAEKGE
jgi:large subunit ribosomal protein L17